MPSFVSPLIIAGPTAIGKSAVAQYLAEKTGAVIVSADSMLVYKGMDIGTAKPSLEERSRVRYIGLDCVNPNEPFSVGDWLASVRDGLASCSPDTPIIVTGGTGLYIKALLNGLDAQPSDPKIREHFTAVFDSEGIDGLHREMDARGVTVPLGDVDNPRRLLRALERFESGDCDSASSSPPLMAGAKVYCLTMDRELLAKRIYKRIEIMFDEGLLEETQRIFGNLGVNTEFAPTAAGAIGYAEALAFSRGEISRDEAIETIALRTRHLAKRQFTWFRHQLPVEWVEVFPGDSVESMAERISLLCNAL